MPWFSRSPTPIGDYFASQPLNWASTPWEHREFAPLFADEHGAAQAALIDAQIFRAHRKDFNNLGIQESRLRRQSEKDTASLKQLQETRKGREEVELEEDAKALGVAQAEGKPFDPAALGFEFSTEQLARRAHRRPQAPGPAEGQL